MKVPLSWLKEYIDLDVSIEKISEVLTLAGLEVDSIHNAEPSFQGVVVAKVLSVSAHPNADKLQVAKVFDGKEELQVVCGASNCRAGLVTAFAKIGAMLTDDQNKAWKIKKGKIRDVESFGMLCSAKELKLFEEYDKILELSPHHELGTDLLHIYNIDPVFEISLTPNLGHCQSIIGIARELSAQLQIPLKRHRITFQEDITSPIARYITIEIQDKKHCHRYCCRLVKNVRIGPSPSWLQVRLESSGLRSINNIVDISNYVMLELGQPLHMFDYDLIEEKKLIVTSTLVPTEIETLDGQNRRLATHSLLISDPKKPLAIAGVMGGANSAVTEKTKNILIEAAHFSSEVIRKTTKTLGLKTDASLRFDKGIDEEMLPFALDRAAYLLSELAEGTIVQGMQECVTKKFIPRKIPCRLKRVSKILGLDLSLREVRQILERLEIQIEEEHEEAFLCVIPSYRNDLKEEIDLIEEVARIYGYNHLPKIAPLHLSSSISHAPLYLFEKKIREILLREGLQEMLTCDLISPSMAEFSLEHGLKNQALIKVLSSKSIDYSVLRCTLLPGLLQVIKHNLDHQNRDVHAFEIGKIHFLEGQGFIENTCMSIILTGNSRPYHFDPKPKEVDFFDLKGILENIFETLDLPLPTFEASHLKSFQPGKQSKIQIAGMTVGALGEIHPSHLFRLGIKERVFFAEINLQDLLSILPKDFLMTEIPLFPGSERDWTLTVKKEMPADLLLSTIKENSSTLLERVSLLDLYQNEKIGLDRKNITLRFFYRDKGKTISLETVEQEHSKLTQSVAEKLRDCIL